MTARVHVHGMVVEHLWDAVLCGLTIVMWVLWGLGTFDASCDGWEEDGFYLPDAPLPVTHTPYHCLTCRRAIRGPIRLLLPSGPFVLQPDATPPPPLAPLLDVMQESGNAEDIEKFSKRTIKVRSSKGEGVQGRRH